MADDEPRELEGEPKAEPKQLSLKEVQAAKDAVYMFKPDPTAGCHTNEHGFREALTSYLTTFPERAIAEEPGFSRRGRPQTAPA